MNIYDDWVEKERKKEDLKEAILMFLTGAGIAYGVVAAFGVIMSPVFVPLVVSKKNFKKITQNFETQANVLEQIISDQNGLDSFNLTSAKIQADQSNENGALISFFGTYLKTDSAYGHKYEQVGEVSYSVNKELAKSVLQQIRKVQGDDKYSAVASAATNVSVPVEKNHIGYDNVSIKKTKDSISEINTLFDLLQQATIENYEHSFTDIASEFELQKSIDTAYSMSNPTKMTDTIGGSTSVSVYSEIDDRSIKLLSVSPVYSDKATNKSFFYIDTLQSQNSIMTDDVTYHKARIEVEGVGLSDAEVYAKFINGEHSRFFEVQVSEEFDFQGVPGNANILSMEC